MEKVGQYLRQERELRDVELKDISKFSRISESQLTLLEEGNFEELPHPTFVKGYIRSYCKCIGLDDSEALLRYETALKFSEADGEVKKSASFEQEKPETKLFPGGSSDTVKKDGAVTGILVVVGLIVIGVYIAFSIGNTERDDTSKVAALPQASKAETVLQADTPEGELTTEAGTEADQVTVGSRESVKQAVAESQEQITAAIQVEKEESPVYNYVPKEKNHELIVSASKRVWIRAEIDIDDEGGGGVRDAMLQEGEEIKLYAEKVFFCS
ncbi:MAG: helix-turn-helix domain-containing protein [Deltaproteobacteria bacterium]|nr:helix-turn-helix domain-containing protein [Deltaproteobacteria bacterium]